MLAMIVQSNNTVYPVFFDCHEICENGENEIILNLRQSFLPFIIENYTGYTFCVFNKLRFKKDRKKAKIRSWQKLQDIRYMVSEQICFYAFQDFGLVCPPSQ